MQLVAADALECLIKCRVLLWLFGEKMKASPAAAYRGGQNPERRRVVPRVS
jgi:hypothetical protein